MKIAFFPYSSRDNKYIELIQEIIQELGIEIYDFNQVFKNFKMFKNTEYFMFSWYENFSNSVIKQILSYIKKVLKLLILKKNKKKIIWVVHNKMPHNLNHSFFSRSLMKFFLNNSYRIIIHSRETINLLQELSDEYEDVKNKVVYIPHPNYIGVYKEFNDIQIDDGKLNLLFLGMIKPYKNVDLLINVFNELNLPNTTLTLAGKVMNNTYKDYINKLINKNNNIKTEFSFIKDDRIQEYIKKSDVLVLPYDIKSSLNSGTIILAFSNKRTVISPLIATLMDFEDIEMFFSYQYFDMNSHREALKNNILKVFNMNKNIIKQMGEKCFLSVQKNNSNDIIREDLKNIFFANNVRSLNERYNTNYNN